MNSSNLTTKVSMVPLCIRLRGLILINKAKSLVDQITEVNHSMMMKLTKIRNLRAKELFITIMKRWNKSWNTSFLKVKKLQAFI